MILVLLLTKVSYGQDYSTLHNQFLISTLLPNIHYGFSLYDMDAGKHVYGIHENQYFTPASNTKVYTLFSSLKHIGDSIPGIQYTIKGDSLLFWGTGDPTFLHPKLDSRKVYDFLVNSDKRLFYVPQESAEPAYRNGWSVEDYQEDFQPDIATFPIYGNVVSFYEEHNKLRTIPAYFEQYVKHKATQNGKFTVNRDFHTNIFEQKGQQVPKNYKISKPFIWSDSLLVTLLQDTLHKKVNLLLDYSKPKDTKVVYSVPRNVLLREMMLPSDNFLAEQLSMVTSDIKYHGFFTDSLRKDMQKDFYNDFGDAIELRDASGLSTYNKISPHNMIALLLALEKEVPNDNKRYLFFPAGGIDGTLRTAYALDEGVPFVWAKTGTINAVHCQSGYLVTRSGRRYAFSFLNNNYLVPTSAIRKEMVRIITYIRQNY